MNSRTLVNLLLFTFLLASAGWFVYKKNKPIEVTRLTSLKLDEINHIRIPKNNGTDIVFNKTQSVKGITIWEMLSPYQIEAHQFRVNTLLSLTQTPVDKLYPASDINLADFALDKPRANIFFNKVSVSFGKSNTLNNKRYIMSENNMALLADQLYPLVSAQPSTFISLKPLADNIAINSIKLPDLNITRNDENNWQASPGNTLNPNQIQAIITHWKTAQAFSVHRYLQRKQLGSIEIKTQGKKIIFIISDDDPWLILARPDLNIEYHLDSSYKNKLLGPSKKSKHNA